MIVVGAVLLALGVFSALARIGEGAGSRPGTKQLQVGECITSAEYEERKLDLTAADCANPDSVHELASAVGPDSVCPDLKSATDSKYTVLRNSKHMLCFAPNLFVNHCYGRGEYGQDVLMNCSDSRALMKVTKRLERFMHGGPPGCVGQFVASFEQPPRTYCMAKLIS